MGERVGERGCERVGERGCVKRECERSFSASSSSLTGS